MTAGPTGIAVSNNVPGVRSLLFIPGNRAAWMPKAVASGADAVVFDLEGSLPAADKATGRAQVREVIDAAVSSTGPAVLVRINDVRSGLMVDDLDAVVASGLTGVLLPQVLGPGEVEQVDAELTRLEAERGLEPGSIVIDPLMETPQALHRAFDIATCSPRVAFMGAGISKRGDIARTMGYRWTVEGTETLYFRSKVLLEVRAAGVPNPLSGMWGDVSDLDGLRRFANHTRDLGYEGMMIIHPSHAAVVNEVFSPTPDELAAWQAILDAMEAAQAVGTGAIRHNGEVVDEAHVWTAKQELARAARWGIHPSSLSS